MTSRSLFATRFYEGDLGDPALVAALEHSCRALAEEDEAGRRWSRAHGYRGYTSYASLNDLPARDGNVAELVRRLNRRVAAFAADCGFGLGGRRLKLEDPRLPMMMAAPPRHADAPEELKTFIYAEPKPGSVFLWESWLRHEVVPGAGKGERISISFNYR